MPHHFQCHNALGDGLKNLQNHAQTGMDIGSSLPACAPPGGATTGAEALRHAVSMLGSEEASWVLLAGPLPTPRVWARMEVL